MQPALLCGASRSDGLSPHRRGYGGVAGARVCGGPASGTRLSYGRCSMTWLDQARDLRADAVVAAAGERLDVRQRGFGPCPWCAADRRSGKDKRNPVMWDKGGACAKCLRCGVYGGGLWIAAGLIFGRAPRTGDNWRPVRDWLAAMRLVEVDHHADAPRLSPRPAPMVVAELPPPPADEVVAFLREHGRTVRSCRMVADYLTSRSIPLDAPCAALVTTENDWPDWWSWGSEYPLAVGGYDGHGKLRSVHARAIREDAKGKTRWPRGYAAGWLFVDPWKARPMLQGEATEVERIVVVEGLTDYLAVAAHARHDKRLAVIGGTAGSWRHLGDARLPPRSTVYIATDNDPTGDKYASEIGAVLAHHDCRRVHLTQPAVSTTTTGENVNV